MKLFLIIIAYMASEIVCSPLKLLQARITLHKLNFNLQETIYQMLPEVMVLTPTDEQILTDEFGLHGMYSIKEMLYQGKFSHVDISEKKLDAIKEVCKSKGFKFPLIVLATGAFHPQPTIGKCKVHVLWDAENENKPTDAYLFASLNSDLDGTLKKIDLKRVEDLRLATDDDDDLQESFTLLKSMPNIKLLDVNFEEKDIKDRKQLSEYLISPGNKLEHFGISFTGTLPKETMQELMAAFQHKNFHPTTLELGPMDFSQRQNLVDAAGSSQKIKKLILSFRDRGDHQKVKELFNKIMHRESAINSLELNFDTNSDVGLYADALVMSLTSTKNKIENLTLMFDSKSSLDFVKKIAENQNGKLKLLNIINSQMTLDDIDRLNRDIETIKHRDIQVKVSTK